jgi:two-component system response regulator MprA
MTWNILVVDDDPAMRLILRDGLEHKGFSVFEAVDGLDSVEKVEHTRPDLIIMDVMMPRMDGLTACRLLKQHEATADVPIIILSADACAENRKAGFEAGAIMYIEKPVKINLLSQTIQELLLMSAASVSTNTSFEPASLDG